MEQFQSWKNRSKLLDSFEFIFDLKLKSKEFWWNLHVKEGLSFSQISNRLGIPKATVRDFIWKHGLKRESHKGRSTRPDNYRAPNPPYGYKVMSGKLVFDRNEVKVCKLIVALRGEQSLSWAAIVDELNKRRIPSRRHGEGACWHRHIVKIIYERWNSKT